MKTKLLADIALYSTNTTFDKSTKSNVTFVYSQNLRLKQKFEAKGQKEEVKGQKAETKGK